MHLVLSKCIVQVAYLIHLLSLVSGFQFVLQFPHLLLEGGPLFVGHLPGEVSFYEFCLHGGQMRFWISKSHLATAFTFSIHFFFVAFATSLDL